MKNIVIASRILPMHGIGGMQVITWDLAKEFVRLGLNVTCITTAIFDYSGSFVEDGVNVVALAGTVPGKYRGGWWSKSRKYFKEKCLGNCDIFLSVSASGYSIIRLKPEMKNTICVFQGHGTSLSEIQSKLRLHSTRSLLSIVKNIKWLIIDLFFYRKFDGIVAAGNRVFRSLQNSLYKPFLPDGGVVAIANGIDLKSFYPSGSRGSALRKKIGIKQTDFIVLVASRIEKQKGIEQAVRAFNAFSKKCPNARLLLVGDGREYISISKLISELKLDAISTIVPAVAISDLPAYLNASDVYVFPTLHEEGLPLLPLEALASGVPVVASNHLEEILSCGDKVYAVEPRNIDSIVAGIEASQMEDCDKRNYLKCEYSLQHSAEQYAKYFYELSGKR